MSATGELWRSLEERADDPALRRWIDAEFPALAEGLAGAVDRRQAMKLMGAALGLSGMAGLARADEIVPWVKQPEMTVPGVPRHYATVLPSEGYGIGAVVQCHEGRPTKVEGNPDHPSSLGASDAVMQAACLELFDPERLRAPERGGRPVGWAEVARAMVAWRDRLGEAGGAGAALLVGPETSPTLRRQIAGLKRLYPALRVYRHAPLRTPGPLALPDFSRATVAVSLDSDVLGEGPGRLAHARASADARRVRAPGDGMLRLHALETTPTLTGAKADHRAALRVSLVPLAERALLAALDGAAPDANLPASVRRWVTRAADDLRAAGQGGLVLGSPAAQARVGGPVRYIEAPDAMEVDGDLADLCEAIRDGTTHALLSLAFDPIGTAPAGLDAGEAFGALDTLWHHAAHRDATARMAHWLLPAAHPFEAWSDARGHDGTAAIAQPLIHPLFASRSAHQLLAELAGDVTHPKAPVRATWGDLDDRAWLEAVQRGTVEDTAFAAIEPPRPAPPAATTPEGFDLSLLPDPWLREGRHAQSAMLQELPRPLTKIVWGNALQIAPGDAERLGVETGDIVQVTADKIQLDAPVWVMPGQPAGSLTLTLGHGRAGPVSGFARGVDGFALMRTGRRHLTGMTLSPTGRRAPVLTTQHHHAMEGRAPVRRATLAAFTDDPRAPHAHHPPPPEESLYPDWDYPRESWGMSIDLTACIGCMACVSACAAENNTPSVGPEECERGHEMHWLRVDRYYDGPPEAPETLFQPVPCMHCEKAPCEPVCPVNATVHTHDGLNAQIYNRCIGTRYCSQNCPYKVRRFNFRSYNDFDVPDLGQNAKNPDVSMRQRGVMEKCTYCVQRISAARIAAEVDGSEEIAEGAVVTACQQACPTQAITFGDLNEPDAAVRAEKDSPLNYGLLEELNTRPRTTYLAALCNPAEGGDG
ncbi:TAT-variant-translocated molybdopterin oxidoreductase [Psychromarinibacter sp. C21-152]|uniref:TAT-variant-translocated molybdopterin oxidoreductase n=1 Tax=Psychromarinibacter sediminicola TaxID=3033385 RepID=A0AAE3NY23_9RHOB|nr:TAT-variant-translocated molybdopterin oxidoreductase [Psychromarinibacter sediminicola]MDF0602762.1 TAT-variant-translocated molybdopterin oxidoreductase [Psychromarinibacter sediminicola]